MTLKTIVNGAARGKSKKTWIGRHIGIALEEEAQHAEAREAKPKAYDYWMNRARTAAHSRTRRNHQDRAKNVLKPANPLSVGEQITIGEVCIELAKELPGFIAENKEARDGRDYLLISITDHFLERIEQFNRRNESLWPTFEPLIVPPKPWNDVFGGAFWGPLGKRSKLIRSSGRLYLEEMHLNRDRLEEVFFAVNAIQETAWRINRRVFDVMQRAWDSSSRVAYRLPRAEPMLFPTRPADIDTNAQARQQYAIDIQEVQEHNKRNKSQCYAFSNLMGTARKFRGESDIYFAHNLDWRGRIYPITAYLSPQGNDHSRALLEFANGKAVATEEGAGWLAVHGSGCWGYDKVSFEERIAWVQENEANIRQSVAEPLEYLWWTQANSPWSFLAWCFDWVGYLEAGLEHISRLPVAMDGSCNGLQNFAGMLRHTGTARAVNLAPSDRPNDIYRQVANTVARRVHNLAGHYSGTTEELEAEIKTRTAQEFEAGKAGDAYRNETGDLWNILAAKYMDGKISRSLVKQPVMTYPYSVSEHGMKEQLTEKLKEMHRSHEISFPYKAASKIAFMLKTIVNQTVREEVVAAAEAMDWLKAVAKAVSEYGSDGLPVSWHSPTGFKVVQAYYEKRGREVDSLMGGIRLRARYDEPTTRDRHKGTTKWHGPEFRP